MTASPIKRTITIKNEPVITYDSARVDYIVDCGFGNLTRYSNLEDAKTHECAEVTLPALNLSREDIAIDTDFVYPIRASGDLSPRTPTLSPFVQDIPRTKIGHKVWPIFAGLTLVGGACYFIISRNQQ